MGGIVYSTMKKFTGNITISERTQTGNLSLNERLQTGNLSLNDRTQTDTVTTDFEATGSVTFDSITHTFDETTITWDS